MGDKDWLRVHVPVHFSSEVLDGVVATALCSPVKDLHTKLVKSFLRGPVFVHIGIVMLKSERALKPNTSKTSLLEQGTKIRNRPQPKDY